MKVLSSSILCAFKAYKPPTRNFYLLGLPQGVENIGISGPLFSDLQTIANSFRSNGGAISPIDASTDIKTADSPSLRCDQLLASPSVIQSKSDIGLGRQSSPGTRTVTKWRGELLQSDEDKRWRFGLRKFSICHSIGHRECDLPDKIVRIYERDDLWVVEVSEGGRSFERTFRFPEHADSFAAGQGIRLSRQITASRSQRDTQSSLADRRSKDLD